MWAAIWEFIKSTWKGRPERIEPVIAGYTGAMSEWRTLYKEMKEALAEVKEELEECRADRIQLHTRIDALEERTS